MHYHFIFQFLLYITVNLGFIAEVVRAAPATERAVQIVPLTPVGSMGAVIRDTDVTQFYYQHTDGSIWWYSTSSGPFKTAHTNFNSPLIPAGNALLGTPIIAQQINPTEIHIFFISPSHILSEYQWLGNGWLPLGGACPRCIQNAGITVQPGPSMLLYVLYDTPTDALRVGFTSAAAPGTISEADWSSASPVWSVSELPN